ncbi:MAG: hypothetical protein R3D34_16860 [Nitratireductor sp.]
MNIKFDPTHGKYCLTVAQSVEFSGHWQDNLLRTHQAGKDRSPQGRQAHLGDSR